MKEIVLSIVVPVYNGENFIEGLINSIPKNRTDIELLFINDGSDDGTFEILENIAKTSEFITVLHLSKSGVSAARNIGLQMSKGRFLWMVDCDDLIEANSIESIIADIDTYEDTEVFVYGYRIESKNSRAVLIALESSSGSIDGLNYLNKNDGRLYLWSNIYNRDFLIKNEIFFFQKLTTLEDSLFNVVVFLNAKCVRISQKVIYNYKYNPQSVTKSVNNDKLIMFANCSRIFHQELLKLIGSMQLERDEVLKTKLALSVLGFFFSLVKEKYQYEYVLECYIEYLSKNLIPVASKNLNVKAKLFSFVLSKRFLFTYLLKIVKK